MLFINLFIEYKLFHTNVSLSIFKILVTSRSFNNRKNSYVGTTQSLSRSSLDAEARNIPIFVIHLCAECQNCETKLPANLLTSSLTPVFSLLSVIIVMSTETLLVNFCGYSKDLIVIFLIHPSLTRASVTHEQFH